MIKNCLVQLQEVNWRRLNEKCDHRCLFWFFFSAYCCHMPSFSCSFFPWVWEKSNKQNKIKKVIWCEYHAPGRFIKVNYLAAVKYTLHFLTTTSIHFSCSLIEREEPSETWGKETNWPGQFFLILTQAKKKQKKQNLNSQWLPTWNDMWGAGQEKTFHAGCLLALAEFIYRAKRVVAVGTWCSKQICHKICFRKGSLKKKIYYILDKPVLGWYLILRTFRL